MNNLMSLQVEELESLDAATEDETTDYLIGIAGGLVVGVVIGLMLT